jgi:hypothetical protein
MELSRGLLERAGIGNMHGPCAWASQKRCGGGTLMDTLEHVIDPAFDTSLCSLSSEYGTRNNEQ